MVDQYTNQTPSGRCSHRQPDPAGPGGEKRNPPEILAVIHDALDSAASAVMIADSEDRVTYVNRAFMRIFKLPECEHVIGTPAALCFPEDGSGTLAELGRLVGFQPDRTLEMAVRRMDGTTFPAQVTVSAVTNEQGLTVGHMASFIDITERHRARKEIRLLRAKLLETEERERKRVARDIHDVIGSSLTAVKYTLEQARKLVGEAETSAAGDALDKALSMIRETVSETKRIYRNLRPPMLDDLGIGATVTWFCREFNEVYQGIEVETEVKVPEERVSESLKTVIYRILREAMNNTAKHSGARLVRVGLRGIDGRLELMVEDDGKGFDPRSALEGVRREDRGTGLAGMKERVEISGGVFHIRSAPGRGAAVCASWPLS